MASREDFAKRFHYAFISLFFVYFLVGFIYFLTAIRITQLNIGVFFSWILISYFYNKQGYRNFRDFKICTFIVYFFLIGVPLFYWAVGHANVLSTQDWVFTSLSPVSPRGTSPCTRTAGIPFRYNPNGFFENEPTPYALILRCYYPSVRWTDSNAKTPIVGYSQDLATKGGGLYANDHPEDYPDPGVGLTNGLYKSFSLVNENELCPGVTAELNDKGFIGKGRHVCAQCGSLVAPLSDFYHCEQPASYLWFCFTCPGYFTTDPVDETSWKILSMWFLGWNCIFLFSLLL